MKKKLVFIAMITALINFSSCKEKEGCTDRNADNYDSDAEENSGCVYRFASTVDISGAPAMNPNGENWDIDGSSPELKMNFGKNSSTGYDFTTDTKENSSAATLTPSSSIQFTNEDWKYQLVDDDLLGASEVIATGTFNPVTRGGSNVLEITNNGISIKFRYTVH